MKIIALAVVAALLVGCASTELDKNYQEYLKAVTVKQEDKPMFKLEAVEGQAISGLKSLTVFAPQTQQTQIAMPQRQTNEWVDVVKMAIGVAGQVGGGAVMGSVVKGGFNAIERAGTRGYEYVQAPPVVAPQANVSSTNTTVTTSTNTNASVGGNGAANTGAGTISTSNAPVTPTNTNSNNITPVTASK